MAWDAKKGVGSLSAPDSGIIHQAVVIVVVVVVVVVCLHLLDTMQVLIYIPRRLVVRTDLVRNNVIMTLIGKF